MDLLANKSSQFAPVPIANISSLFTFDLNLTAAACIIVDNNLADIAAVSNESCFQLRHWLFLRPILGWSKAECPRSNITQWYAGRLRSSSESYFCVLLTSSRLILIPINWIYLCGSQSFGNDEIGIQCTISQPIYAWNILQIFDTLCYKTHDFLCENESVEWSTLHGAHYPTYDIVKVVRTGDWVLVSEF